MAAAATTPAAAPKPLLTLLAAPVKMGAELEVGVGPEPPEPVGKPLVAGMAAADEEPVPTMPVE